MLPDAVVDGALLAMDVELEEVAAAAEAGGDFLGAAPILLAFVLAGDGVGDHLGDDLGGGIRRDGRWRRAIASVPASMAAEATGGDGQDRECKVQPA